MSYYYASDVALLDQLLRDAGGADVLLLHDWPRHVERHATPAFDGELDPETLCQETFDLISQHQPQWVFCGHMHHSLQARIGDSRVYCLDHIDRPDSVFLLQVPDDGRLAL